MEAWYPFKIVTQGRQTYTVPDDTRKPIESESQPAGNWWGPFHCLQCAIDCGSFGATEDKAWRFNHGTDDEKFCAYLSDQ